MRTEAEVRERLATQVKCEQSVLQAVESHLKRGDVDLVNDRSRTAQIVHANIRELRWVLGEEG